MEIQISLENVSKLVKRFRHRTGRSTAADSGGHWSDVHCSRVALADFAEWSVHRLHALSVASTARLLWCNDLVQHH